jgi:prepilin-type N-terminal cleavage/methylation domain-containing protein
MLHRRGAFTLIEVLVVMAIIALLAAILFPVFRAARLKAGMTACISQLRQHGMALKMYRQDYDALPPLLSTTNEAYVKEPRLFVCPNDGEKGQYEGNIRLEGNSYLASGVSYSYIPNWLPALELGWWNPAPNRGEGKWEDQTPVVVCDWHWATRFMKDWSRNQQGARGWQLVLMMAGSVRRLRIEEPIADFTPEKYR